MKEFLNFAGNLEVKDLKECLNIFCDELQKRQKDAVIDQNFRNLLRIQSDSSVDRSGSQTSNNDRQYMNFSSNKSSCHSEQMALN